MIPIRREQQKRDREVTTKQLHQGGDAKSTGKEPEYPVISGSSPDSDGSRHMELDVQIKRRGSGRGESTQSDGAEATVLDPDHGERLGSTLDLDEAERIKRMTLADRKRDWLMPEDEVQADEAQSTVVEPALDLSSKPTPSPDLKQLDTPLEKVNALGVWLQQVMVPRCEQFIAEPPPDPMTRKSHHDALIETIFADIIIKADKIEVAGNETTHIARRMLMKKAQGILSDLDSVLNDDVDSYRQCPHLECGGRVFKDLNAHMLTHQTERPEKCPLVDCEYHIIGFARKYDQRRHTLTHYKGTMVCGFCPGPGTPAEKSFYRADVFKRHLTAVHGVEQTPPNVRKRSTIDSANMGTNLAGDTTGKCSICLATFSNAQGFYEHLDDCVLGAVPQRLSDEEPRSANDNAGYEYADHVNETLDL